MSLAIKGCTKCVVACFQVKITFKRVLGVGVCFGRGRVKQRPKRGWRFSFFFVNFGVVSVRKVKLPFLAQ
jgi:hypothetical protein